MCGCWLTLALLPSLESLVPLSMPANLQVKDPASAANFHQLSVEHIALDWTVDFEASEVEGTATLELARHVPAADIAEVVLDVFKLNVKAVKLLGRDCAFEVKDFTGFGAALVRAHPALQSRGARSRAAGLPQHIPTGPVPDEDRGAETWRLRVEYRTQGGPALSFLQPAQTAGKAHPFLFTQGQACLNRSLFPCQDTPAVRQGYSARVAVPRGLTAVMSAERSPGEPAATEDGLDVFSFEMTRCIPSYLVALAVGRLERREIGPRSAVFAEAPLVDAAQKEFEGVTEQYLAAGERLFGPYLWGRYDVLIMVRGAQAAPPCNRGRARPHPLAPSPPHSPHPFPSAAWRTRAAPSSLRASSAATAPSPT